MSISCVSICFETGAKNEFIPFTQVENVVSRDSPSNAICLFDIEHFVVLISRSQSIPNVNVLYLGERLFGPSESVLEVVQLSSHSLNLLRPINRHSNPGPFHQP